MLNLSKRNWVLLGNYVAQTAEKELSVFWKRACGNGEGNEASETLAVTTPALFDY